MYDWPEVREATDSLWSGLRDALRQTGMRAPDALARDRTPADLWHSPALALGQTCGLPYVSALRDKVLLLGTPDYAVPGCDPGWYRSAIVVRADDRSESLADFRDRRWAFNDSLSQSGYQAMLHSLTVEGLAVSGFLQPVHSGSHRGSIRRIANDEADVAAIDYVSWRLAEAFLPAAGRLRVLQLTAPTPGLPYIAATDTDAAISGMAGASSGSDSTRTASLEPAIEAIASAISLLPESVRATLGLNGFWRSTPADYDVIDERRV